MKILQICILSLLLTLQLLHTAVAATHHPERFLKEIKGKPDEAKRIVAHFCAQCHAENPKIPLGAPRIGNFKDWQPRLLQGFNVLMRHTDEGFNAMPPRGGCFECSDRQLKLAILEMIRTHIPQ